MGQIELRPLGIGEILDRAVTLFVARFASIVLILAAYTVPIAIVQYIGTPDFAALNAALQRYAGIPAGNVAERTAILRDITAHDLFSGPILLALGLAFVFGPLAWSACLIGVRDAYAGRPISLRAVYRAAVRCWPAQLGNQLIFAGVVLAAFVAVSVIVLVVVLVSGALGLLGTAAPSAGLIVVVPLVILAFSAMVAIGGLAYLVYQLAMIATALEGQDPIRAFGRAFGAVFGRGMFWRSVGVGLVVLVVSVAGSYLSLAVGLVLTYLTHQDAFTAIVSAIGGLVLNAFLAAAFVVYAIDVRVRREGYDLALAAQADA